MIHSLSKIPLSNTVIGNEESLCYVSNTSGKRILRRTLANHIYPLYWGSITETGFFFCSEIQCPVIYFNNLIFKYITQDEIRTPVMHKMQIGTENRPMCYCKNVLESVIIEDLTVKKCCDSLIDIQNFTEANTGKDCAITNPSGRCCGTQIRELLEWTKNQQFNVEVHLMEEAMSCCAKIEENSQF